MRGEKGKAGGEGGEVLACPQHVGLIYVLVSPVITSLAVAVSSSLFFLFPLLFLVYFMSLVGLRLRLRLCLALVTCNVLNRFSGSPLKLYLFSFLIIFFSFLQQFRVRDKTN